MMNAEASMFKRLAEDVRTALRRDPAARGLAEVLLGYPGVHALLSHRVAHALWISGRRLLARLLAQLSRGLTGVEIHPGATIGRRVFIDHGMGVVIGETAVISDDVLIYHGVTLGGTSLEPGKRHPTIGDGVILGAGAIVLGDIQVGANARVGAGTVVTRDVPEAATVVGARGRVMEERLEKAPRQLPTEQFFIAGAGI